MPQPTAQCPWPSDAVYSHFKAAMDMFSETSLPKLPFLGSTAVLHSPTRAAEGMGMCDCVLTTHSHFYSKLNESCLVRSWAKLKQSDFFFYWKAGMNIVSQHRKLCKSSPRVCSWASTLPTQSHACARQSCKASETKNKQRQSVC